MLAPWLRSKTARQITELAQSRAPHLLAAAKSLLGRAMQRKKAGICSKDYSNVIDMNGGEQRHSNLIQIGRLSIAP
jgi:hypothetical protein